MSESNNQQLSKDIEQLQRKEIAYRAIIDGSADGITIVDEKEIIRFANPAAEELLGRKESELVGSLLGFPVTETKRSEVKIVRPGKSMVVAEMNVAEIEWEGALAYLVAIRDMTLRKEMERVKDEFIATVSHELRTPLTAIRESVAQVNDEVLGTINDKQKKFLGLCLKNTDRLGRIVNSLLDIAKLEAGKLELKREIVNFAALSDIIVASFAPKASSKSLEIKATYPLEIMEVYADRDKLTQVLSNLIGNALKFTEQGKIVISLADYQDYVECIVSDTGKGVAQEDVPKLFDKFQQFGKLGDAGDKGTGLGLPISKGLTELHGGKMWVESKIDQGSTFHFTMPKYNQRVVLYENIKYIIDLLKKEYEELALFIFRADNYIELEKQFDEQKIDMAFLNLTQSLGTAAVGGELIDRGDKNEILILGGLGSRPPSVMVSSYKRTIKKALMESSEQIGFEFSWGQALYPADGRKVQDLFSKAYSQFTSEKEERLSKRILIIDDEVEVAKVLKRILESVGYSNISQASSGDEAFSDLASAKADLIILDLKMPQMSGYEVIGRLKEDMETKDIPILIMSGYQVEIERIKQYMKEKAIFTLTKPFNIEQVKKFVDFML